MDDTRLVEGLHEHTAGFAQTVAGADPGLPVPTCPEWPLRVLVGHIGQSHRWAASIIRSGPSPIPEPFDADPGNDWADWLQAGATELTESALAAGDSPVWTFFGPQPARFWVRRMLHDITVHHADAAIATGSEVTVAPDLAADGISEWLEVVSNPITPSIKPVLTGLRGSGQTLQLQPEDGPGWLITRAADGVRWTRATAAADATLTGPVADLLLVLTRRLPVERVAASGDRALIEHWLDHTAA